MQQEPQAFEAILNTRFEGGKSIFKIDSPEDQEMQLEFLQNKAEKQSVSLVSGCMSFATPFLPLGFLSTFFLLGKLDGMDKGPESLFAGREDLTSEVAKLAAVEALARKRRNESGVAELDIFKMVDAHQRQSDSFFNGRSALWAEKRVLPAAKNRKGNEFFVLPGDYKKKAELRKQKMAFEAVKESKCKNQDFSSVAEIAAKLEVLDKALKRLFGR